jgi:hypothetical protein
MRNAYRIFARNRKEKRPLAYPTHKVVDNIKKDLGNTGCDDMELIPLVQRPMADSSAHSKNLWVPQKTGNLLTEHLFSFP